MEYPQELIEAFEPGGRGVVAFVGSGPSCAASLPSWGELLRRIAVELEFDRNAAPWLERKEFLQVAQFLAQERPNRDIQERVAKQIKQASNGPAMLHRLIVRLPFAGIVTTNYDLLLTEADRFGRYSPPITYRTSALRSQYRQHFLLHLHGHVDDPETIIVTRKSYDDIVLDDGSRVHEFLSNIFQNRVVLFIGFGFADEHIDSLLRRFKHLDIVGGSTVFALVPTSTSDLTDKVRDSNLRFRLVNPIYIDEAGDHGVLAMEQWLENLRGSLDDISRALRSPITSVRSAVLVARLRELFVEDQWLPLIANALAILPNRPDLRNLARVGLTRRDVDRLFDRLTAPEMRYLLIFLNQERPYPVLQDALSCFSPLEESTASD